MKTHREELVFRTAAVEEIVDMTDHVEEVVARSGVREGVALVFPLHTSAAVYVSDSDPGLTRDLAELLARLIPRAADYAHDRADPKENAHAHLRALLCGHQVTLPVQGGALDLGPYQRVYYAEFDGRRDKEVQVKVLGS